jgi:hypothetical protein
MTMMIQTKLSPALTAHWEVEVHPRPRHYTELIGQLHSPSTVLFSAAAVVTAVVIAVVVVVAAVAAVVVVTIPIIKLTIKSQTSISYFWIIYSVVCLDESD